MIRILLADDHAVVRQGVKHILSEAPDVIVAGEAGNSIEVLESVRKNEIDIVLLDIAMPGRDGLDIIKDIKSERPETRILMLSMFPEELYALRAFKLGASGYLTKDIIPEELIKAIKKISLGGKYISPAFSEKMLLMLDGDAEKLPHETLSNREHQIMRMIASGKTLTHIAEELSLSVKTVATYRSRILEKLGLANNAEITHYAVKNHLID